jgi:hypothetical protein
VPVRVLAFLHFGSGPVWAHSITGTGIQLCPYQYWHFCTLIQYQYGHSPLPVMAFNSARTSTGIYACWFSTSMDRFHYWYWLSMMPVPVLTFLHFGSVSVWAYSITGNGIQLCPYRYWHCCILVQYQYGHGSLPELVFSVVCTGIGILELWFSTSMGIFHLWYWH